MELSSTLTVTCLLKNAFTLTKFIELCSAPKVFSKFHLSDELLRTKVSATGPFGGMADRSSHWVPRCASHALVGWGRALPVTRTAPPQTHVSPPTRPEPPVQLVRRRFAGIFKIDKFHSLKVAA